MSSHPDVSQQNWWTFNMGRSCKPWTSQSWRLRCWDVWTNEWTCPIWWEEDKNMMEDSQRNNRNRIWIKSNEFLDIIHQHWPLTRRLAQFAWLNYKTKAFAASGQGQWIGMDRYLVSLLRQWHTITRCSKMWFAPLPSFANIVSNAGVIRETWQDLEKAMLTAKKVHLNCC